MIMRFPNGLEKVKSPTGAKHQSHKYQIVSTNTDERRRANPNSPVNNQLLPRLTIIKLQITQLFI